LFILFPTNLISADEDGFKATFDLAKKVAAEISSLFKFPGSSMKIVHEKTAKYLIMYSAKCYALDKYESIKDKGKLEVKGLSFSKRDCCKFVASTLKEALDFVLRRGDLEGAKNHVKKRFRDLIDGRVPEEELAIYQKLSKSSYNEGQKVAHALLAQKIDARNPGLGPKSGESVKV
jgi:DNA polymerase elongation subunit (family B)